MSIFLSYSDFDYNSGDQINAIIPMVDNIIKADDILCDLLAHCELLIIVSNLASSQLQRRQMRL